MKRIKIIGAALLLLFGLTGAFSACTANDTGKQKISVVTTVFPVYDWIRSLAGEDNDHVEITYLLDNSVDLHSYQPTVQDLTKIAECDLFVYVGGESDLRWTAKALESTANEKRVVVNLMETLGDAAREEEAVEGMEEEEEGEEGEEEEGPEYDEHIWLSVRNAKILCKALSEKLAAIDPDRADHYAAEFASYESQLNALDADFASAVEEGNVKTLLFADRFPFLYLVKDYGLSYYAAFKGCSGETEASFETVAFLTKKVDELSLKHIMTIETSDQKMARTVRDSSVSKDQEILTMHSLQSVTAEQAKTGTSYLSLMQENLKVLKEALK